jgi:hypothetical protein
MSNVTPINPAAAKAGQEARRRGCLHGIYRPVDGHDPLRQRNQHLRQCVAISTPDNDGPYRRCLSDWTHLKIGDFINGSFDIMFITDILPDAKLPIITVVANTMIDIQDESNRLFLSRFPAYLTADGDDEFLVIVPNVAGAEPRCNDLITAKDGKRYVITRGEFTNGIWKLSVICMDPVDRRAKEPCLA